MEHKTANETLELLGLGKNYFKTTSLKQTLHAFIVLQLALCRVEGKTDKEVADKIIETLARELEGFYREHTYEA